MTEMNRSPGNSSELESQLESAIQAVLAEPLGQAAVERVKARAQSLAAQPNPTVRPAIARPAYRGGVLTLISLAATILLVVGAVTMFSSTPSAFAAVIEQLKTAGTLRYTRLVFTDQQDKPIEVRVLVAQDGRERSETAGTVSIMDSAGQSRVTLIESTKTAIVPQQSNKASDQGQRQLQWLEQLRSHAGKPDRRLGVKTLDGRRVEGFVARQGQHEFTIWVDAKSSELVQIEHDGLVKGSPVQKVVMKDFRFNETLDESLFSFEVPADYTVMKMPQAPELLSGEESIVEALRGFTKLADGKFPRSIVDWSEWTVLLANSGQSLEETTRISARLGAILPFLTAMPKDDYQYTGAGKTTRDDRTIVFWHRTKDRTIRAIYNDLSVAQIKEQDLPAGM